MKAFPTTIDNEGYQEDHGGMDLRDYFAAKAMQAMLSWEDVGDFDVSKEAYMMADAMISERDRK